jgi:hypothetical protein
VNINTWMPTASRSSTAYTALTHACVKNGTNALHKEPMIRSVKFPGSAEKAPRETNSMIILCRVSIEKSPTYVHQPKTENRDAAREKRLLRTTVQCQHSQLLQVSCADCGAAGGFGDTSFIAPCFTKSVRTFHRVALNAAAVLQTQACHFGVDWVGCFVDCG